MEPNLTKQEGIYNQGVGRDSVGGKLITINIEGRGRGWILVKDNRILAEGKQIPKWGVGVKNLASC